MRSLNNALRLFVLSALLSLSLLLPSRGAARATEGPENILIINSYRDASPLSDRIISLVVEETNANSPDYTVSIEHMHLSLVKDTAQLGEIRSRILDKHKTAPRLVIYIDSPAWVALHETLRAQWPRTPAIIYSEMDFVGPLHYYLSGTPIPPQERTPLTRMVGPRDGIILLPIYIDQTLGMMRRMLPHMRELLFISDSRWISAQNRAALQECVQRNYPDLQLTFLTEVECSTDALFERLSEADSTQGILFYSWYQKQMQRGNILLTLNAYKIASKYTRQPIFTLHYHDMREGAMLGGYFFSPLTLPEGTRRILQEVIEGAAGSVAEPPGENFYINYPVMVNKHVDGALAPPGTVLIGKPPGFLYEHRYHLIGALLCLVILLLIIRMLVRDKRAQRIELQHMADYRDLFDKMPVGYLKVHASCEREGTLADFRIEAANPAFARLIGLEQQRKSEQDANLGYFMRALELFLQVDCNRRRLTFQYFHEPTRRNLNVLLSPSSGGQRIDAFVVDNTELSSMERRLSMMNHKLALALEVADIAPWRWDLQQQIIHCDMNTPFTASAQQESQTTLTISASAYFAAIHKQDRDRVQQAFELLTAGRIAKAREEYRILVKKEGRSRFEWVEVQAAVEQSDGQGRPIMLIGSSILTTQRKELEHELIAAKEKAEESNRLKSAFLANMSHEIRTPLNAIIGFSGVLANTDNEEERQEYMGIIENNNALLLQLINDILDLSKIEAGMVDFVYSDVDLNRLLYEQVQATQLRIAPGQPVRVELAETLPDCFIRTEKNRLTQILTNLTSNAVKFTREGTIRIGTRLEEEDTLRIWVEDTGCGIPKEKQEEIFGRFVKLDHFAQGSGLGLAICQTIVQHLGGRIGVESQPGKGSTFWFAFPYRPVPRPESRQVAIEPLRVERERLKVLIAEDNADNFRLFESILRQDYTILHAWNGREAVELFKAHSPHIVLMDISMPEMNGYEATAQIRKLSDSVPIIAVTAYAFATDEERILQSGFDAYAAKPLNARQLRQQILDLLARRLIFF